MVEAESFDEDLVAVLIDKTVGALHTKTVAICDKARNDRNNDGGLRAYFEIHTWFMRTTGLKFSERMRSLTKPPQAKSEEAVVDLIEAWEREEEEVKRQDPEVALSDPWRMTASKCILPPRLDGHVELRSGSLTNYEELRREIMAIAVQRRLTRNITSRRDPNSMARTM